MSSVVVVGFFALRSGRRVRTQVGRADGTSTGIWHVLYDTAIVCHTPPFLPAELRKYSPVNDIVLPDETVAFVVAKAYVPPGNVAGNILLEAVHLAPLPGDPSTEQYDASLPDFQIPLVFGLGTVTAGFDTLTNGAISFPVTLSDYVRGEAKQSVIQCRLDKSTPRWRNVPAPNRGAIISFFGTCLQVTMSGHLSVDIENIVFCTVNKAQGITIDDSTTTDDSPAKRRKFAAYAPPRAVISTESLAHNASQAAAAAAADTEMHPSSQGTSATHTTTRFNFNTCFDTEPERNENIETPPISSIAFQPLEPSPSTATLSTDTDSADGVSNVDDSTWSMKSKGKRKAQG